MILANLPITNDVPLAMPMEFCCNCGSTSDPKPVATDLRRMPLLGLAGTEVAIKLPFPYCPGCVATARRRRPTLIGIAAVSALLALAAGMGWLFLGPQLPEETLERVVGPAIVVLSVALVLAFYGLRRRSGAQTSYYQPIKLMNTAHRWPADITGLELAFTNERYAERFAHANAAAVASDKLKVSRV